MPAEIERQRVAMMSGPIAQRGSWEEYRAVCWDHGNDNGVPNWMGEHTHPMWIDAKIDAAAHNYEFHPRRVKTWAEILNGPDTEDSSLLMNARSARHVSG